MGKKGKEKNTVNKATHSRLIQQKANKIRLEKQQRKERLKAIIKKANQQNENTDNCETTNH